MGAKKAEEIRKLHEEARPNIEQSNARFSQQVNQGRKKMSFEVEDWVWLHLRKERFPTLRSTKLAPRETGPFLIKK